MSNTVEASLVWKAEQSFEATSGARGMIVDGEQTAGWSPMQHLLVALGGCMGIDIADILMKMRTPPTRLGLELVGERPEDPPRRFNRITLLLKVEGDVPLKNVDRAVELSRDRYCSVWRTFSQDTEFNVDIEIS
ncbi:MAG: OsmC family peroxiredoxin [Acidobacteria bacterium]|nr:OsmC family peroxiredoxin [Acidobacteriota bacterium]